jgi:outer membrane protein OmpA-like peptidoglycan-associated protein
VKRAIATLGLLTSGAAQAEELRFITCPIYRDADAGKKSGCWLADDPASGKRYDVSLSAAKPDWAFAVLVEGKVSQHQNGPCGGIVLDPARTSVLEAPCPRHMLPAEGFAGRKFLLPARNVDPLNVPRAAPKPPFANRTFRLYFDWDSKFLAYQREDWSLDQALTWIRAVKLRHVTITGFAAVQPERVSGTDIAERPGTGKERADQVAEALHRLGIAKDKVTVLDGGQGAIVEDEAVDGLSAPSRRRVDIFVEID